MKLEVVHGKASVSAESSRLRRLADPGARGQRGAGGAGSGDPREHGPALGEGAERRSDAGFSWPWPGKPEQLEIERLRKENAKLRAERDILKNDPEPALACGV